jgi:hypothetical protein
VKSQTRSDEQVKASITLEFDNPASLYAAVDRLRGKDAVTVNIPPNSFVVAQDVRAEHVAHVDEQSLPTETKTRKPRADAGKPRGPYKTSTNNAGAEQGGTQPTEEAGAPAAGGPGPDTPAPAPSSAAPVTGAAASLTLDDAKAALRRVKDTKGLGTPACIGLIQSFGFDRISDLPAEKFPELLVRVDEMIAKQGKA